MRAIIFLLIVFILGLIMVLGTKYCEAQELRIKVVRVPGVRALKAKEVRKAVRISIRDFLSKATDRPIAVTFAKLQPDPCYSLNTLGTRYDQYKCLRAYTDSVDMGVGYDVLYMMMPPIIDNKVEWVAGMAWICNNFGVGNAVKKIFPGAQFADRWGLSVIPFSHEVLHSFGASHISEPPNIMNPDSGYQQSQNPWPLPVLEETREQIRECLN